MSTAVITASGGPFRGRDAAALAGVGVQEALAHPTWTMGAKITIDSATLMNKGLELIEAHHLFGLPYERIEVVVHPQSLVHAMVRLRDGSVLAHCGPPDMRVPIGYALRWPDAAAARAAARPGGTARSTFEAPDEDDVPLPAAGPRGRPRGRHGAGRAERGQRGRRRRPSWPGASASSTSPTTVERALDEVPAGARRHAGDRAGRRRARPRAAAGDAVEAAVS